MAEPLNFDTLAWVLTTVLEVILLFLLLRRKLHRSYPGFFVYVLSVIVQGLLWKGAEFHFGERSKQAWAVYWMFQAVVVCARWIAVVEITSKVLADYGAIRRMASRILMVLGAAVLAYSFVVSDFSWMLMVLSADRAVELCIASVVVCMFLFARYYRLPMLALERQLAVGFCLYCCSRVVNDSVLEHWHGNRWNFLSYVNALAFLASLLIWIAAVREPIESRNLAAHLRLTPERYGELSEKLNSRLHLLNHRLDRLSRSGGSR
ncbi:MAG: hypothetical protein WBR26_23955 [Candidatus Acidiferrum sp.]